jgi:uncharacterized membrane protein
MTTDKKHGLFARITLNIRNRLISGIFVVVPFAVTVVIIMWLFNILAKIIQPIVAKVLEFLRNIHLIRELPQTYMEFAVSLATILSLLFLIYLIGVIAKYVAGRRLLALGETMLMKIPLVRTIYSATKQVTTALTMQDSASFKSVVLVEFPRSGCYSLGFLTGFVMDAKGDKLCKVFVSTTPNPTTGFFILLPVNEVRRIEMTIEEAFKMIISAGIVAPEKLVFSDQLMISQ